MKLPKAGVFAHSQAITVSEIIAAKISGKESNEIFCADAKLIKNLPLIEGTQISTMAELTAWTVESDKVITF